MFPIALEINRVFGLPAHPLLVHAAVVLVPLGALAFIVAGCREAWRRVYYFPATLIVVAGGVAAFLAKESGEPLTDAVRREGNRVGEHPEQGDTAFLVAMILALVCIAVWSLHQFAPQIRKPFRVESLPRLPMSYQTLMYAATVPIAILAIVTMVIAGHSGAELVWKTNAG